MILEEKKEAEIIITTEAGDNLRRYLKDFVENNPEINLTTIQ